MEKRTDILSYFASMHDPRVERTRDHLLEDIVFITIAAVICTAETWNEIEDLGNAKYAWLKIFLSPNVHLPNKNHAFTREQGTKRTDIFNSADRG